VDRGPGGQGFRPFSRATDLREAPFQGLEIYTTRSAGATTPFSESGVAAPRSLARGWPARPGCGAFLARSNHLLSRSRLSRFAYFIRLHPQQIFWLTQPGVPPGARLFSYDLQGIQAQCVVLRTLAAAAAVAVAAVAAAAALLVSPSTRDLPILVAPRSRWSAAGD
jgi:hypothetical protein